MGLFFQNCRKWNQKPAADKTWQNFKTHFQQASTELRLQREATSANQGFAANMQTNADLQHIRQMLQSTHQQEGQALAAIANTNQDLTQQVQEKDQQIQKLKQEISSLKRKMRQPNDDTKCICNEDYCWTHGFLVKPGHNSGTCKKPALEHQREATKENRMGGSTAGLQS